MKFDPLWQLDIGTISNFFIDIDNDIVRQYRDIQTSNVKPLMSYPISVQCPSISKIRSILGTICHTSGGRARTGHVPAPPTRMGPASWSSTRLEGMYSCATVLTPFPAGVQHLLSVAAVARPWCGLPAQLVTVGSPDFHLKLS